MARAHIRQLVGATGLLFLALGLALGWLLGAETGQPAGAPAAGWLVPAAAFVALLAAGAAAVLWRFLRGYLTQVRDLAQTGRTLLAANPAVRAPVAGVGGMHPDVRALSAVFDALGDRFRTLGEERAAAIRAGREEIEQERNLLAALMAELTEGVVVCNAAGQILLYNRSARVLLRGDLALEGSAYIGLGRSLFSVLEREAILHAIAEVEARRAGARSSTRPIVVSFVTTGASGLLLRARLAPFGGSGAGALGAALGGDAGAGLGTALGAAAGAVPGATLGGSAGAPAGVASGAAPGVAADATRGAGAGAAPSAGAGGASDEVRGYVLIVQDLSEGIERSMRRDRLLQTLTERTRGSVAAIRAAIEAIAEFPQMSEGQRVRLQGAILDEAQALSDHLGETLRSSAGDLRAQWRLEEMHGGDLLWSIQRRLAAESAVAVTVDELDDTLWLKIDSYTLMQGLSVVLHQLRDAFGVAAVQLRLQRTGSFGGLDLAWTLPAWALSPRAVSGEGGGEPSGEGSGKKSGEERSEGSGKKSGEERGSPPAAATPWAVWQRQALAVDDGDGVLSLREVAERHGGEVWVEVSQGGQGGQSGQVGPGGQGGQGAPNPPSDGELPRACIRLLLPLVAEPQAVEPPVGVTDAGMKGTGGAVAGPTAEPLAPGARLPSRPEYYDFDLFKLPGELAALADRPLRGLACTVFDTETTGLQPEVDEILAIGAIRIVNGRMLRQEIYEQLVDPQRPIPEVAIGVHGITDQMVRGQPTIGRVLPHFHRFAHDTVLVGHNVAFDLRMFEVKIPLTGVQFDQPVLDTLLLSTVVHPDAASHSLEAIAARLGLQALGRHTALGDALLTGEIYLHLLPLLEAQGIFTLRAALEASQQSYLARLTY